VLVRFRGGWRVRAVHPISPCPIFPFPLNLIRKFDFFFLGILTSDDITRNSSHINLGKMFCKNNKLRSVSTISSSASRGCKGKEAGFVLQVFMAQVRKLRVRSFIFDGDGGLGFGCGCGCVCARFEGWLF
jgi:hypothetical protein